ncbi:hypothetical protein [Mycobacteroides abscessus]|uniref:hypothetical protein n=1 Tax=Mycobacteroides abscessus TaxID=36809 RepID=UPI000928F4B6|nr:hypothetical protein [Mycobacteroides abscessus]SHP98211.1 Uncharacterised protein [Mycobacteroides abscessus subsp. abscessus]SHQ60808.1 Uncharacterised protein [Mycobacteroides abscessus subsp. abscessus]SKD63791.1 Uncharacterised protein [Mycobacteroides abscessus subsp. abscessus]SLD62937.1 Uncharacterised protein [Mycobacteroides abscessus subsp. abscessus]
MTQPYPTGNYPPVPPPPQPARRQGWVIALAVTAVVGIGLGTVIGVLIGNGGDDAPKQETATSDAKPSEAEVHAQDIKLCTDYAIINTAIVTPDEKGSDLLPAVTALQVALTESPNASEPVREAISEMADVYRARIAAHGKVRTRGLAEPPTYSAETHKLASSRVWAVCGLDE